MVNSGRACTANCCAGKGAKSKKKKKGGSLTLTPESGAYLCNVCVCLKFLTAAGNADCYRVAAAGCLPALVQLAAGSKQTQLRQSAKVGTYVTPGVEPAALAGCIGYNMQDPDVCLWHKPSILNAGCMGHASTSFTSTRCQARERNSL
jgi:hypothetical protein